MTIPRFLAMDARVRDPGSPRMPAAEARKRLAALGLT